MHVRPSCRAWKLSGARISCFQAGGDAAKPMSAGARLRKLAMEEGGRSRAVVFDPKRTLIQSSVVSAGLIAGKPAPTGISPAFRHALYLWEPRLPAMGREAAPITDVRFESIAGWAGLKIGCLHIALSERCREQMGALSGLYQLDFSPFAHSPPSVLYKVTRLVCSVSFRLISDCCAEYKERWASSTSIKLSEPSLYRANES